MTHPNDRNLALELVRVTEAAALQAARWMGRGDKINSDQAAVDAMRRTLNSIQMDGIVVIGEGEKDEAPMLYVGERLGSGDAPLVDIAVDPIDGTRLLSNGMPNSVAVIALAERGSMLSSPDIMYMDKIVVGPEAVGKVDIERPPAENLRAVAGSLGKAMDEVTAVVLDRPRHEELIRAIREAGCRIKLITDGDVAGAIMVTTDDISVDIMLGIGGAPEAVLAACAIKCTGGDMQAKLWPRNDAERAVVVEKGIDTSRVYGLNDLVSSDRCFFAATGITDGELLGGVHYLGASGAMTESLVMRSQTGTVRRIQATHKVEKMRQFGSFG
ncbi:MAG TPA: class II fructose-bisphosphatase [Thermomicrobiales bacterium]|jgi:fructose-1,6-bisphosphatase II|nr:class II fructose-bisphosphatase [Thermomicrobiales bacterium]